MRKKRESKMKARETIYHPKTSSVTAKNSCTRSECTQMNLSHNLPSWFSWVSAQECHWHFQQQCWKWRLTGKSSQYYWLTALKFIHTSWIIMVRVHLFTYTKIKYCMLAILSHFWYNSKRTVLVIVLEQDICIFVYGTLLNRVIAF